MKDAPAMQGHLSLFIQLVYEVNHTQIMRANHRFPLISGRAKLLKIIL